MSLSLVYFIPRTVNPPTSLAAVPPPLSRQQVQPDEIYNLGAMSHVKVSFEMSEYTAEADGVGVLRLLNAIRSAGLEKKTRLYQVSHWCCCLSWFVARAWRVQRAASFSLPRRVEHERSPSFFVFFFLHFFV